MFEVQTIVLKLQFSYGHWENKCYVCGKIKCEGSRGTHLTNDCRHLKTTYITEEAIRNKFDILSKNFGYLVILVFY